MGNVWEFNVSYYYWHKEVEASNYYATLLVNNVKLFKQSKLSVGLDFYWLTILRVFLEDSQDNL